MERRRLTPPATALSPHRASLSSASTVTRADNPQHLAAPPPSHDQASGKEGHDSLESSHPREAGAETSPPDHLRAGSLTDAWMVMPFSVWPRPRPPVSHRQGGEKDYLQSRQALRGSKFTVKGVQLFPGAQNSSIRGDSLSPPLTTRFQAVSSVKRTVELFQ